MRQNSFRAELDGEMPTLYMYDDIGPEWLGMISAETVTAALSSIKAPSVNVRINSGGGDCFEALAIYNALTRFPGQVIVDVDALAASAASLIAMAGDTIRMASNAMMMVHNAWTVCQGNKDDLRKVADTLDMIDATLRDTYVARTGLPTDQIRQLMDAESWMPASECVGKGFADEISQPLKSAPTAKIKAGRFKNTPAQFVADILPPPKPITDSPPPRRLAAALALRTRIERLRAAV